MTGGHPLQLRVRRKRIPTIKTRRPALRVLVGIFFALLALSPPARAAVTVASPGGQASVAVSQAHDGAISWSVSWRGRRVLDPAPIGLRFEGERDGKWRIADVVRRSHDEQVTGLIGKTSSARDRYNEAVLSLSGGRYPLELVVRAYDDGVAYRWRFRTSSAYAITDEQAGFGIPGSARAWAMPAAGFNSPYEDYYRDATLIAAAPADTLVTLPLLMRRGDVWAGVTEAALHDWAGLYLVRHDGQPGLGSRLSPRPDRPGVAVIGDAGEHLSPWRVAMLGDAPGRLIESNLVTLLNPPADRRDWSWIKPGKTSFPWWNDYVWPNQSFVPGLNTATMKAYIDFDADHGIPFHTLDGFEDKAWYGGAILPDGTPQDLTRAAPGIDIDDVLAHARRRGVGIRVWCHWLPLRAQLDQALDQWARWGVSGLMVDFMDRDDQEMVAFYDEVARKAADRHMTVIYHGAFKPTGENRTWPNVLTREAVRGTEYNKFDDNPGSTPRHEATIPFTRMLAGPMDTHQGGFDQVLPGAFHNKSNAPQVMGTRARALATYIVQENAAPMVADTPANYLGAAEFDFIARTPVTWDETRVLAGDVGKYIVIVRRKGSEWWLGAITDGQARTLRVQLPMSTSGRWMLDGYADTTDIRSARHVQFRIDDRSVELNLAAAGGFAARLSAQ